MQKVNPNPRSQDDNSLIKGKNWISRKIVHLIGAVTPCCSEIARFSSEKMDHPLPWMMRLKVRLHFLVCCYCERYQKDLLYLRKIMRSFPTKAADTSTATLPKDKKDRLKELLRNQSKPQS